MSDYGVVIYAGWIFKHLLEWSRTTAAHMPAVPVGCSGAAAGAMRMLA